MKSKLLLLLVVLMSFALVLGACASTDQPAEDTTDDQQTEDQAAAEAVTIGAVLPLTGSNATTGKNLQAAMEVALDIINNSHDLDWDIAQNEGIQALGGAQLEILWGDCQSDASIAATEAASLLEQNVAGVVGAYASGYSASVAAQALEYGVPMVCGSSSSASLTDGVTYDFGSIFNRIAANDEMETIEFYEFLTYLNENYDAGIETVAIAFINNAYGIHADEMFAKYAGEYGFEIVARVAYESTITAADTEAAQIIAADPDVVFQASYIGDLTMFAQAYNSYGFKPAMFMCYCGGFQDASFATVATSLGSNSYAGGQACSAVLADKLPVFNYVNELYKAKTGYNIDGPALEEFASVIILAQAMEKAGSADPAAITEALRGGAFDAPYFTIGSIEFNENGQNTQMASFVTQLIDGVYQVVYPIDDYVTSEPAL